MSSEAPFIPPKKKPNVFWWIAGAIVVLLLLFFVQLFGPSPCIVVSRQTTYVTEPLHSSGAPDYEKHLLNEYRAGVTPENNAAALIWPALWFSPGELDPSQYEAVAAELGLSGIPSPAKALQPIYKRIVQMLRVEAAQKSANDTDPTDPNAALDDSANLAVEIDQRTDDIFQRIMAHPWTSKEFPDLSKWAQQNQQPLDSLVAASTRDHCYFPSPSLLNDEDESLIQMLLPGIQTARESGRSLTARAMWHLGEGRTADAWRDLYAAKRIGHLMDQGHTLVEQLVGMAISNSATDGTLALLHDGKPSSEQARRILADLSALTPFSHIDDSIDRSERLMFADVITRIAQGRLSWQDIGMSNDAENYKYLRYLSINWNTALEKGNTYYDRFAAAARLPTYQARTAAINQVEADIDNLARSQGPDTLLASVLSRSARSDAVGNIMITLFLPALNAAMTAQDRHNSTQELLRLAAALAVFRAEHGTYPAKLDELTPAIIPNLPVDLFNAKPFLYNRIDNGYLLYSTGANGQDDAGSNEMMRIFEGHNLDDMNEAAAANTAIPNNADDISIRVPRPAFKVPDPPAQ